MPELPEIETVCRQLRDVILGAEITRTRVLDPKLRGSGGLTGRKVEGITRQGKAVALVLEGGGVIIVHLRMTGRFLWHEGKGIPPHTRLVISFSRGRLLLIDPRRFATVTVSKNLPTAPLGSDLLNDGDPSQLWLLAQKSKAAIKAFLMDQRRIAGIGNIYACEILHRAEINPWRKSNTLSRDAWITIAAVAKEILKQAITCRGTSVSDWRDLFGTAGENQRYLMVYGREGEACYRCGERVERRKLSGRGTYYCPACQNEKGGPNHGTMEL
ncbi:MAG: DNA-formamidopyrimidine glycosylase [Deltaproteobacteria bacterium RBG_16_54_18]|nr:MAG: DNA-formamidopyrimidine glycosylase [Deltaproteobacteria bacterium RBG_16_54_18]